MPRQTSPSLQETLPQTNGIAKEPLSFSVCKLFLEHLLPLGYQNTHGCQLHSGLKLGLQRSSCPLSHRFKITGDERLKPIPVICSEQIHRQPFCSSIELGCLSTAWAMWGCIKSPPGISKLGCLKISIRANVFKASWQSRGLLLTTQFGPFEVAQLGYPGQLVILGRSWVQSHIWEICYLSISWLTLLRAARCFIRCTDVLALRTEINRSWWCLPPAEDTVLLTDGSV